MINIDSISGKKTDINQSTLKNNALKNRISSDSDLIADVYNFSQTVLKELMDDNIPSIPSNYSIYFEKMLDKGSDDVKKKVGEVLENSDTQSTISETNNHSIYIEKEVKQSYIQIKSMLQAVALIYKNLGIMKSLTKKHSHTLQSSSDLLAVQKVLRAFNGDLEKLISLFDKHLELIKINYEEISRVFKAVEEQAIYDTCYDVYNKKFLLSTMSSEAENVKRYGYKSSFLLVKIHEKILSRIKNAKDKDSMQSLVVNTLTKTSRRSDVVAHYGDGCFVMVMKHTDLVGARKACERILALLYEQEYVSGGEHLNMEFQMVGCALQADSSLEEVFSAALDKLISSHKNEQPVIMED